MHRFVESLKRQAEENPIVALAAAAAVLQSASKLLNANTARSNSKTWKKEVNRRTKSN